ncbi:hypothetical protein VTN77DRAFT_4286 [Rasamsonia byssochlamydoides]|uniref:uncharacterized protein n=1 Tax=Rasamsonia byssochlamydoides TaxID=89139 RepID=UPI00374213F2
MLAKLPSEIIYHIATFLPTAGALASLAQTCKRLHRIITAENGRIFRAFVQSQFPSIETPPFWRDAAQALTSRSRALDRHAIIGRFVVPPADAKAVGIPQATRHDSPTLGYRPAIDSYEVWTGGRWADRREVLCWGAAAEILMRIRNSGDRIEEQWLRFNDLDHISSHDDIRGVYLLRPDHPSKETDKEHLIYARARGDLVHVAISPDDAVYEHKQTFVTDRTEIDRIDFSTGPGSILAAHSYNGPISLYHTTTGASEVHPFAVLTADPETRDPLNLPKFLSSDRLAVGTGRLAQSIVIFDVSNDSVSRQRELTFEDPPRNGLWRTRKSLRVSAIAPFNLTAQGSRSPGDVFLAGWGDRRVRLHDLRSPKSYEREFMDTIDNNPIYCIQPFGHDRFLVGAGADAIVKIFDLRTQNTYSYVNSNISSSSSSQNGGSSSSTSPVPRGDFSFFISHHSPTSGRRNHHAYRGPIYAMSSPSPSSSTIYTGIVDGIVRLDFASTDDLTGSNSEWYRDNLALGLKTMMENNSNHNSKSAGAQNHSGGEKILELSGYERPSPDNMSASAKLRAQKPFWDVTEKDVLTEQETGWDRRWKRLDEGGFWRRRSR